MFSVKRKDFGAGFIFGVATASHQVEGDLGHGRGPSIWDSFAATPANTSSGDTGAVANDQYNRWPEDLDLIRDGGFDTYRFSTAWSRLIPKGTGAVNQQGVDYYSRLIDGMLERNIKPYLTLYHWDLPSVLQDRGGWANRDIAGWLADYASLCARHFGDRVTTVATINEPWCVAWLSHYVGRHAPGHRDIRDTARAMHHVMLAHGAAVAALRAEGIKSIGIVTNLQKCEPATGSAKDAEATRLVDAIYNGWFLGGLYKGQYPSEAVALFGSNLPQGFEKDMPTISAPLDWVGVNYYTRVLVTADESGRTPFSVVDGPLEKNEVGWEIYPKGLTDMLVRVSSEYTKLPIIVTENGMVEVDVTDDKRRVKYYDDHLRAVLDARAAGADVRGYIAWSLLDNFEWEFGYDKRFGIVGVDRASMKRTPRSSYEAFQNFLTS